MFRETDPGVSPLLSLGVRIRESASLRDAPFGLLKEDHEHAEGQAYHDGEGGELAAVDEVARRVSPTRGRARNRAVRNSN